MRRGEIYWADLEPRSGSEQRGRRPVVVVSSGSAVDGNHWVELGWGGPGRLRLLEAAHAEIAELVGDRPGRLRHLFFDFDEPSHVPGARQVATGRGRWVVDADDVLGTRLVIASSAR